jgi:hypothetical protein
MVEAVARRSPSSCAPDRDATLRSPGAVSFPLARPMYAQRHKRRGTPERASPGGRPRPDRLRARPDRRDDAAVRIHCVRNPDMRLASVQPVQPRLHCRMRQQRQLAARRRPGLLRGESR